MVISNWIGESEGSPLNSVSLSLDADMFEFHIVSLDNKQWLFEAGSAEEREDWVEAIEQQILNSLQVKRIHLRLEDWAIMLYILCY
jgi:hypothetical protein